MITSYNQVVWILNNHKILSRGEWPDPKNEEYYGKRINQAFRHAYFENPCLLIAEVHNRIKKCGLEGILVEERYGLRNGSEPMLEDEIARIRRMDFKQVRRIIKKVINYCASEDMMGLSYGEWKRINKYKREFRD